MHVYVRVSVHVHMYLHTLACLPVCLAVCLSVSLSVSVSLSLSLSLSLSVYMYVCRGMHVQVNEPRKTTIMKVACPYSKPQVRGIAGPSCCQPQELQNRSRGCWHLSGQQCPERQGG